MLTAFTLASSLALGTAATASASDPAFLGYGWPKSGSITVIPLNSWSYNSVWQPAMDQGMLNWNGSPAHILFSKTSKSPNTVVAASYTATWYGLNSPKTDWLIWSKLNSFQIQLNARTISRDAKNVPNFIQSVFAHELGHSVWLADNPPETWSLMNYSRDRNTVTKPASVDVTRVNTKY